MENRSASPNEVHGDEFASPAGRDTLLDADARVEPEALDNDHVSNPHNSSENEEGDEDESDSEDEDKPLFLRRAIPDESEDSV